MICKCNGFIGNLPPGQGGGGGGGAGSGVLWETTLTSATDTIDIPGGMLGGNRYNIELSMVPGNASASIVKLYVNGDTTDSNYTNQFLNADSTTVSAGRQAQPALGGVTNGTPVWFAEIELGAELGDFFYRGHVHRTLTGTTHASQLQSCWNHTTTVNTITALQLKATVANTFGIGTVVRLIQPYTLAQAGGGGTTIISEHHFDVSKSGIAQSLPDNSLTQITGFSENWDTGNDFATNTYTTPSNGIYAFNLSIEVVMGSAAGIWELMITTGSSPLVTVGGYAPASASLWLHVSTGPIYRTSANLIRAYAFQNTGQSCTIQTGGNFRGAQLWAGTLSGGS